MFENRSNELASFNIHREIQITAQKPQSNRGNFNFNFIFYIKPQFILRM